MFIERWEVERPEFPPSGVPGVPQAGRPRLPRRQLHVVVDNYATHKHERVQAWLAKRPRVRLHVTPTYASWLNLVEVFFAILGRQALRRGDFASVEELVAAIGRFCDGWNQRCQPFCWTKDAEQLLATLKRPPLQQQAASSG